MQSLPKPIRRLLPALSLVALGISSPAAASISDHWTCIDDKTSELTVVVGGTGAPPAGIYRNGIWIVDFAREEHDLASFLGHTAAVYAGDEGAFTTIADKAVLRLGRETYFCQIIGEEPDLADLQPGLTFDGAGLELRRPGIPASRYDFGTSKDELLAVLGRFLGTPTERVTYGEDEACPGEVITFASVTLFLADDQWIGWALSDGQRGGVPSVVVTGPNGSLIGAPAVVLEYSTSRYEDSTLGDERIGDGVHYIVAESGRSSTITNIWAGEACVAR